MKNTIILISIVIVVVFAFLYLKSNSVRIPQDSFPAPTETVVEETEDNEDSVPREPEQSELPQPVATPEQEQAAAPTSTPEETVALTEEEACQNYLSWRIHYSYDGVYKVCGSSVINTETGEVKTYKMAVKTKGHTSIAMSLDNTKLYYTAGFYEPYGLTEDEMSKIAKEKGYGLRVINLQTGEDTLLIPHGETSGYMFWNQTHPYLDISLEHSLIVERSEDGFGLIVRKLESNDFDYILSDDVKKLSVRYESEISSEDEKEDVFNRVRRAVIADSGEGLFFTKDLKTAPYESQVGYWQFRNGDIEFPTKRDVPAVFLEELEG